MAAGFLSNNKNRNVIPRWRDFQKTIQLGELNAVKGNITNRIDLSVLPHEKKIIEWNENKTIKNALELFNSSIIIEDEKNLKDTTNFLSDNKKTSQLFNKITAQLFDPKRVESLLIDNLDLDSFDKVIGLKIKNQRIKLSNNQLNSISLVELARLYLIIGKENAAERCIITATKIAPHNRYISRVASRFFTHTGDFNKAKQILKKNTAFKFDPWLLSAEIGISSLENKSSNNIKIGLELINSNNYSSFDLNELLSAIATADLNSGSIKSSKRLFNQSLIKPNDNALAQAVWAKNHIVDIELNQKILESTPIIYEANAKRLFRDKLWLPAFLSTLEWFIDQPFSQEPANFATFIATSILEKFEDAIKICKYGLKATPGDFDLLNNLAFAYLNLGDVNNARNILSKINKNALSRENSVVYLATIGLLFYKLEFFENGDQFYNEAIKTAERIKNKELELLAKFYHFKIKLETQKDYELIVHLKSIVKELESLQVFFIRPLLENSLKRIGKD